MFEDLTKREDRVPQKMDSVQYAKLLLVMTFLTLLATVITMCVMVFFVGPLFQSFTTSSVCFPI